MGFLDDPLHDARLKRVIALLADFHLFPRFVKILWNTRTRLRKKNAAFILTRRSRASGRYKGNNGLKPSRRSKTQKEAVGISLLNVL